MEQAGTLERLHKDLKHLTEATGADRKASPSITKICKHHYVSVRDQLKKESQQDAWVHSRLTLLDCFQPVDWRPEDPGTDGSQPRLMDLLVVVGQLLPIEQELEAKNKASRAPVGRPVAGPVPEKPRAPSI